MSFTFPRQKATHRTSLVHFLEGEMDSQDKQLIALKQQARRLLDGGTINSKGREFLNDVITASLPTSYSDHPNIGQRDRRLSEIQGWLDTARNMTK